MAIFYIDYENVGSAGIENVDRLDADNVVHVFYSKNADTMKMDQVIQLMNSKAKVEFHDVTMKGQKNALDFQLIAMLYFTKKENETCYIISKDTGYDAAIIFGRKIGAVNVYRKTNIFDAYKADCRSADKTAGTGSDADPSANVANRDSERMREAGDLENTRESDIISENTAQPEVLSENPGEPVRISEKAKSDNPGHEQELNDAAEHTQESGSDPDHTRKSNSDSEHTRESNGDPDHNRENGRGYRRGRDYKRTRENGRRTRGYSRRRQGADNQQEEQAASQPEVQTAEQVVSQPESQALDQPEAQTTQQASSQAEAQFMQQADNQSLNQAEVQTTEQTVSQPEAQPTEQPSSQAVRQSDMILPEGLIGEAAPEESAAEEKAAEEKAAPETGSDDIAESIIDNASENYLPFIDQEALNAQKIIAALGGNNESDGMSGGNSESDGMSVENSESDGMSVGISGVMPEEKEILPDTTGQSTDFPGGPGENSSLPEMSDQDMPMPDFMNSPDLAGLFQMQSQLNILERSFGSMFDYKGADDYDFDDDEPEAESSKITEASANQYGSEASESQAPVPEPEVSENEALMPEPEVSENQEAQPEPEALESQAAVPEPEVLESQALMSGPEALESQALMSGSEALESQAAVPEPEVSENQEAVPEPEVSESQAAAPEPEVSESQAVQPEKEGTEEKSRSEKKSQSPMEEDIMALVNRPEFLGKITEIMKEGGFDLPQEEYRLIGEALKTTRNKNQFYQFFRKKKGEVAGREFYLQIRGLYENLKVLREL